MFFFYSEAGNFAAWIVSWYNKEESNFSDKLLYQQKVPKSACARSASRSGRKKQCLQDSKEEL